MSQSARDLLLQHLQQRRENGEESVFIDPQIVAHLMQSAPAPAGQRPPNRPAAANRDGKLAADAPARHETTPDERRRHVTQSTGGKNTTLAALMAELENGPPAQSSAGASAPAARQSQPHQRPQSVMPEPAPTPASATGIEFFDLGKVIGSPDDPKMQALHEVYQRVGQFYAQQNDPALRETMVFAVGNPYAKLMFVGEAPGADEEAQREPFVGRAGQLLTKMIGAMGLSRSDVYISNIVKYRPRMPGGKETGNVKPSTQVIQQYRQFVLEEIRIIKPGAIIALGATAAEGLAGLTGPMKDLHGKWHDLEDTGSPVMITYHPAFLLRNNTNKDKRVVWEDLLLAMQKLQMPISEKQQNYFLK